MTAMTVSRSRFTPFSSLLRFVGFVFPQFMQRAEKRQDPKPKEEDDEESSAPTVSFSGGPVAPRRRWASSNDLGINPDGSAVNPLIFQQRIRLDSQMMAQLLQNNITEIRTDALELLVMLRRPVPRVATMIGA